MGKTIYSLKQIQKAIDDAVKKNTVNWLGIYKEILQDPLRKRKDINTGRATALKKRIINQAAKGHLNLPKELLDYMSIANIERIKGKMPDSVKKQYDLDFNKGGISVERVDKITKDLHKEVTPKQKERFEREKKNFMDTVLIQNSKSKLSGDQIIANLLRFGIKQNRCKICGNKGRWMGKELKLELHHKGDRSDMRPHMIKLVCPNCHTLTRSYKGGK